MPHSKSYLIQLIIFLFPISIATVQHGGSTLFALLLLTGLALGWPMWQSLESWEKKVLIGFLVFFLLVSVSLVNTQEIFSGIKKEGRYVMFPLIIPIYLLLKKYQLETGKLFFIGFMIAPIAMFFQSYHQITTLQMPRAEGAYSPIVLGDISILIVIIVICFLLTIARSWQHYFAGLLVIGLAISVSIISGSRGAWILLPIALIHFMWAKRDDLGLKSILLIVIFGGLLFFLAINIDRINNGLEGIVKDYQAHIDDSSNMSSFSQRIEMWRYSIIMWKEHPMLGTGIGDFNTDLLRDIKNGKSFLGRSYPHAHNIYFDTLATAGLVGLFGMIIFIQILPFKMFYSFWKKEHDPWLNFYSLSGMTTIIAFAVFGLTEGWLARKPFVLTYVMCILVFMSSIAVVKLRDKEQVINHES